MQARQSLRIKSHGPILIELTFLKPSSIFQIISEVGTPIHILRNFFTIETFDYPKLWWSNKLDKDIPRQCKWVGLPLRMPKLWWEGRQRSRLWWPYLYEDDLPISLSDGLTMGVLQFWPWFSGDEAPSNLWTRCYYWWRRPKAFSSDAGGISYQIGFGIFTAIFRFCFIAFGMNVFVLFHVSLFLWWYFSLILDSTDIQSVKHEIAI